MRKNVKIIAALAIAVPLGLLATWLTVIVGTMGGTISDGPWRTSPYIGSTDASPYLRALTALHGVLALNSDEAVYYTATTDSAGNTLDGKCVYRMVGRNLPARWWSITAYGADDFLIPNPPGLYSVSMTSVEQMADGSYAIFLSKKREGTNWIPVIDGPFSLLTRLYNPGSAVTGDPAHVELPTIMKVSCE